MTIKSIDALFSPDALIELIFKEQKNDRLIFEFHLIQRAGKCMRCSLTYGLPKVFSRHPVINLKRLVEKIDAALNGQGKCADWKLGATREISENLHVIPLTVFLENAAKKNIGFQG